MAVVGWNSDVSLVTVCLYVRCCDALPTVGAMWRKASPTSSANVGQATHPSPFTTPGPPPR